MNTAQACSKALQELIRPYTIDGEQLAFNYRSDGEAKARLAEIRGLRKQLRIHKNQIAQVTKEIRQSFIVRRARVEPPIYLRLVNKRWANGHVIHMRERLYWQEEVAIQPYHAVAERIEQLLSYLDAVERQIAYDSIEKFAIRN